MHKFSTPSLSLSANHLLACKLLTGCEDHDRWCAIRGRESTFGTSVWHSCPFWSRVGAATIDPGKVTS